MRVLMVSVLAFGLAAQSYPPAFPRTNVTKLLETDRIVVWDVAWPKGQPTALHRHVYDQVGTYYQAGGRMITSADGAKREATTPVGNLSTTRKGTTHIEEGATDLPLRAVFIELKLDRGSGRPEAFGTEPLMFPREGARTLLDDERVAVWDCTWSVGAGVRGRYGRDAVWVWLGRGTIRLTPLGGGPTTMPVEPGQIRHVRAGTAEAVEALAGSPRAMIFAFK